jgi:L-fuconolactonase
MDHRHDHRLQWWPIDAMSEVSDRIETIDAQIHTWTTNSEAFPWDKDWSKEGPGAVAIIARMSATMAPYDSVVAAMDKAEVSAALLVSHRIYGLDNGYALKAARNHPRRFKVVGILDLSGPDIARDTERWAAMPETAGVRVSLRGEAALGELRAGSFDLFFEAAERHHVPIFIFPPGALADVGRVAANFPRLKIVVDHFGLPQPPFNSPNPAPFADVDQLLKLARFDNVYVKATALPLFTERPYPFDDLWPPIERVLRAFGADRVMWGTDFTRPIDSPPYRECIDYLRASDRLSIEHKRAVLGRTLRLVVNWPDDE